MLPAGCLPQASPKAPSVQQLQGMLILSMYPRHSWLCLVHKGKGHIGRETLGRSFPASSLLAHPDTPLPRTEQAFNTPPSPLEREALLKIQLQTCQLSTPVCLFHDISSPYSTSGAGKHSPTQWVLRLAVSRGGTPYQPQEDYSLSTQQHEGKSYRRPVSHCEISSISAPHLKPHREFWTTAYPSKG